MADNISEVDDDQDEQLEPMGVSHSEASLVIGLDPSNIFFFFFFIESNFRLHLVFQLNNDDIKC